MEKGNGMLNSLFDALFGCSHRRTTFPLTPSRKSHGFTAPASRHNTYVVCLDCGKEFAYNWEAMRVGEPVAPHIAAEAAESFSR